jgi:hypothetical protein
MEWHRENPFIEELRTPNMMTESSELARGRKLSATGQVPKQQRRKQRRQEQSNPDVVRELRERVQWQRSNRRRSRPTSTKSADVAASDIALTSTLLPASRIASGSDEQNRVLNRRMRRASSLASQVRTRRIQFRTPDRQTAEHAVRLFLKAIVNPQTGGVC